jgi:alkylation response protein AidB-like acyl-CoA dehydrogenase
MLATQNGATLEALLTEVLKPKVTAIDIDGVYPVDVLRLLGEQGYYMPAQTEAETVSRNLSLVEDVASICGSTAFMVWCHLTAMSYVRNGHSEYLKREVLPELETGQLLGGTGLSNPMKFYAGMEDLRLQAEAAENGVRVNGMLPFVSNLADGHWFGVIAKRSSENRVMAFVPCSVEGLSMWDRSEFIGMNGTGTYNCHFRDVHIPSEYILCDSADELVRQIRPGFVLTQVGMALGVIRACIDNMRHLCNKQRASNQYLRVQPDELEEKLSILREKSYRCARNLQNVPIQDIFRVRLESAYLALEASTAGALHSGGAGYIKTSPASRRLREAQFISIVTPAVKHLERVLQNRSACIL